MQTRAVIEQAKGMLMAERRIDADSAFALLVEISQSTHRKLVDVAKALVAAKMSPPPSD
ncbi:MAG: ANTAR domain-containing protein [Mycobacteriales bacterium]